MSSHPGTWFKSEWVLKYPVGRFRASSLSLSTNNKLRLHSPRQIAQVGDVFTGASVLEP